MAYIWVMLSKEEYKACKATQGTVIEVPLTDVVLLCDRTNGTTKVSVDLASLQRSQDSEKRKLLLSVSPRK